jgi:hypothetical protein
MARIPLVDREAILIACYAVLAYNMNTYELAAPEHPSEKALPV